MDAVVERLIEMEKNGQKKQCVKIMNITPIAMHPTEQRRLKNEFI